MKTTALFYFTVVLVLILSGCQSKNKLTSNDVLIEILNYGKSETTLLSTRKDDGMPNGMRRTGGYSLNITEKTDTIEIYVGSQFGVEYIIKSESLGEIDLTTIWTYPETLTNRKGQKFDRIQYEIDKFTNTYTYSNYTLEEDYELISGNWNLKLFHKNKMLLEKTFVLVYRQT